MTDTDNLIRLVYHELGHAFTALSLSVADVVRVRRTSCECEFNDEPAQHLYAYALAGGIAECVLLHGGSEFLQRLDTSLIAARNEVFEYASREDKDLALYAATVGTCDFAPAVRVVTPIIERVARSPLIAEYMTKIQTRPNAVVIYSQHDLKFLVPYLEAAE